jgi:adenylylsulfate kinase-like enzyme
MILVLFGQPNCGKSTLAKMFPDFHNIDGDELRDLFKNKDFSREGRIKNLNRASDIAHYIHSYQNNIVLSLVYPYKEARDYLNSLNDSVAWVYLTYEGERGREKFHVQDFEVPTEDYTLHLNTSELTPAQCVDLIKKHINEKLSSQSSK